jgi:hypothetical protein
MSFLTWLSPWFQLLCELINLIDGIPPELKAPLQKAGERTRNGLSKTIA